MRTIAVLNQKGGVGKTTTTVNTAAALATLGMKVVVIDLDPQAHLTIHLGVESQTIRTGSYEVLTQSAGFEESLMLIRPNLWLLGADINLVGAETELVSVVGREIILREAMLACQEQFDYCLIDCAPSLGLLSLNALAASQEVLIPLQPHFLALQGFGKLLQTVDLVNKRINRDLKVMGVLLCMFDTRASLPNEVRADIDRFLTNARGSDSAWADARILPAFIRRNIKLAEAPSYGQTIFEYDPTCNGATDYRNVARFFMGIEPKLEGQAEPESEIAVASEPAGEHESQEVHHALEPTLEPDPATEGEAVFEPEPCETPPVEEFGPQETHAESEPASEHDSGLQQEQREHPPIQIHEFQFPAPQTYSPRPFQDGPASPVSPPEVSQTQDEGPDEARQSHDEPEQVGF